MELCANHVERFSFFHILIFILFFSEGAKIARILICSGKKSRISKYCKILSNIFPLRGGEGGRQRNFKHCFPPFNSKSTVVTDPCICMINKLSTSPHIY